MDADEPQGVDGTGVEPGMPRTSETPATAAERPKPMELSVLKEMSIHELTATAVEAGLAPCRSGNGANGRRSRRGKNKIVGGKQALAFGIPTHERGCASHAHGGCALAKIGVIEQGQHPLGKRARAVAGGIERGAGCHLPPFDEIELHERNAECHILEYFVH